MEDPRETARAPVKTPKAERMSTNERMDVRERAKTAPTGLLRDIMAGFNKLNQVIAPNHHDVITPNLQDPIPPTPKSPKKPKGSRNLPKPINRIQATNDPTTKRPAAPRMKMTRSNRPITKKVKLSKHVIISSSDDESEANRDRLISKQLEKFKVKKRPKRLRKRHLAEGRNKSKVGKQDLKKLQVTIIPLSDYSSSTDAVDLRQLFSENEDPANQDVNNNDDANNNNNNNNNNNKNDDTQSKPNSSFSTETAPSGDERPDDPIALALESAEICPLDFPSSPNQNKGNTYKGKKFSNYNSLYFLISDEPHLLDAITSSSSTRSDTERGEREDGNHTANHPLQQESPHPQQLRHYQQQQQQQQQLGLANCRTLFVLMSVTYNYYYCYVITLYLGSTITMPGPKNITREERKGRKQEQRPSSATRKGLNESTATIVSSDDEDEQPSAKVSKPKTGGFREAITKAYNKKVEETKSKRAAEGKLRVDDDLDVEKVGKTVDAPTDELLAPVKHADAPTISLRDLLPEGYKDEAGYDEEFKLSRIDFMILYRKITSHDDVDEMELDDPDHDWAIPNESTFDKVMDEAVMQFTAEDADLLEVLDFSRVGWTTGVGLLGFRTDKLTDVERFAGVVKHMVLPELLLRFCLAPRKLLMDTYALTIYFNSAFQKQTPERLIYWLLKFNPTLKGRIEIVEVRKYPPTHENTRRAGAKIIAFEGDKAFLDSLYRHPKDHPFQIRFGGNLYIRGGDRIDESDPEAHQRRRPRMTRDAVKQMMGGARERIFEEGEKKEDDANKKAQQNAREDHASYKSK